MVIGARALHRPFSVRHVATPLPRLLPKPNAIFTIDGTTAMHFASLMILFGMPLSGVAMISSNTLAELSILFSISDLSFSLSALQPALASSKRMHSARRLFTQRGVGRFISHSRKRLTESA